jgi:hypothetical protein
MPALLSDSFGAASSARARFGVEAGGSNPVWANDSYRRLSPVAPRPSEGLLTEPTTDAQPWRRERVLMPLSRHSSRFLIRRPQVNGAQAGQR